MKFEKVHTIRDFYDGVRSGTANLRGAPQYFECLFDEGADNYSNCFRLFPVSLQFLEQELRHWAIFRDWETGFYGGRETVETHPGTGGLNLEYDDLGQLLNGEIRSLEASPGRYRATFRVIPGQEALPPGMFRELEVCWQRLPAE